MKFPLVLADNRQGSIEIPDALTQSDLPILRLQLDNYLAVWSAIVNGSIARPVDPIVPTVPAIEPKDDSIESSIRVDPALPLQARIRALLQAAGCAWPVERIASHLGVDRKVAAKACQNLTTQRHLERADGGYRAVGRVKAKPPAPPPAPKPKAQKVAAAPKARRPGREIDPSSLPSRIEARLAASPDGLRATDLRDVGAPYQAVRTALTRLTASGRARLLAPGRWGSIHAAAPDLVPPPAATPILIQPEPAAPPLDLKAQLEAINDQHGVHLRPQRGENDRYKLLVVGGYSSQIKSLRADLWKIGFDLEAHLEDKRGGFIVSPSIDVVWIVIGFCSHQMSNLARDQARKLNIPWLAAPHKWTQLKAELERLKLRLAATAA